MKDLTGKCKEDFEDWYLKGVDTLITVPNLTVKFYFLPPSMQFSVYIDFFDSVDINISLYKDYEGFHWCIGDRDNHDGDYRKGWGYFEDSRQEARTKAIEKANEIYNKL